MDVIKSNNDMYQYLTFKVVGGIINFRFILGDSNIPALVKKFQETCIGQPILPPFWSLGFHQSRWGYDSADALLDVIKKYKEYDIPLDTIWSDIDYMEDFKDFTIDLDSFPLDKMKKITEEYRYVPILDAGVAR